MAKTHGKGAYFALDDLSGSLTDISTYLRNAGGLPGTTARMDTTTFGEDARRREVMGRREGGPVSIAGPFNPAGSKIHGKNVVFLVDEYAPYSYFRSGSIARTIDLPNTETFGDSWREHEVVGLKDGSFSLEGLFDSAADASDAVLRDFLAQETPVVLSLGLHGFTIGNQVEMAQVVCTDVREPADVEGLVSISSQFETDDVIDLGVSLHDHTAATATGAFSSVDESATTTTGGVGHLHVTAFTGSNVVVKIQDSPDDSTWADLITFATLSGTGVERSETSATTQVDRYVRGYIPSGTVTSVTFALAFARRGYTYGTAGRHRHFAGLYGKSASSSFEYGPEGSSTGDRKLSGECRLSNYTLNFSHDALVDFSGELMVTGSVTEGTFS